MNATPVVPVTASGLLIAGMGTPALTVSVSVAFPVPPALVAPRVTLVTPAAVGVPVISPVDVFTLSPAGSGAALKLAGLFVAVIV